MAPKPVAIGDDVAFVLANGEVRPAKVVRAWSESMVNAIVTLDGANDIPVPKDGEPATPAIAGFQQWVSSVHYERPSVGVALKPGTWHWLWQSPALREYGD